MAEETELTSGDIADVVTREKPKQIGSKLKSKRSLARIADRVRKDGRRKTRKIPATMAEFDIHEHPELQYFPVPVQEHPELNLPHPEPRKFLIHDDGKY